MIWLLLPEFLLIGCGWVLCRYTALNRPIWDGIEKLVYYLLFPTLLFVSALRNPLNLKEDALLVTAAIAVVGLGVVLAYALGSWPGWDKRHYASGAQVAFRFNSYVALAVAERLAGPAGLASVALMVSVCVPLVNLAAVWPLARASGVGFGREVLRNPLILATVAGLAGHVAGLVLPEVVQAVLSRVGSAALPLGLMAVGAGLRLGTLGASRGLSVALLGIRHLVLPAAGLALGWWWELPPTAYALLVVFAAMPSASSAYVLAVRLGGDGPYVASLVSLSTLLAMAVLPACLAWVGALNG